MGVFIMFTVYKTAVFNKTKDENEKKISTPYYIFSVCDGFICFYFDNEDEAATFCKMLNWLTENNRKKDVQMLHDLINLEDFDSFFSKKDEYYNEQGKEQGEEQGKETYLTQIN